MNYTSYGYRINALIHQGEPNYTWVFLPGGPGLGAQYLESLWDKLHLPGTILCLDFPKDGTNSQGILDIDYWKEGLIALLDSLKSPIIVAHDFSGMLVLDTPEIQSRLVGLVLMNTTTGNTFFHHTQEMKKQHSLPDLVPAVCAYHLNPSDELYKAFWQFYKYYYFTALELPMSHDLLTLFAFNSKAYYQAISSFYQGYTCRWRLFEKPVLTIASENDYLCPPSIFTQDSRFQSPLILNKITPDAGHCPWLRHLEQVQEYFMEFIALLTKAN